MDKCLQSSPLAPAVSSVQEEVSPTCNLGKTENLVTFIKFFATLGRPTAHLQYSVQLLLLHLCLINTHAPPFFPPAGLPFFTGKRPAVCQFISQDPSWSSLFLMESSFPQRRTSSGTWDGWLRKWWLLEEQQGQKLERWQLLFKNLWQG